MATRTCPACGVKLLGAHANRKWCSERCRRTQYAGTCEACGARTNGYAGPGKAARHCSDCAPRANATWSRERIVAKIREWAGRYGEPPSTVDWKPAIAAYKKLPKELEIRARFEAGEWPTTNTVIAYFSTWNEALAAAGFEPRPAHRPPGVAA